MTYTPAFVRAVALVLEQEGGFQNHPEDKGNWTGGAVGVGELRGTNFGISAAAFPDVDIGALTESGAIAFYFERYWVEIGAETLPPALGVVAFDIAVLHGPGRAKQWLAEGYTTPATLTARRMTHFTGLSSWSTFGKGWVNRAMRVLVAADELERGSYGVVT